MGRLHWFPGFVFSQAIAYRPYSWQSEILVAFPGNISYTILLRAVDLCLEMNFDVAVNEFFVLASLADAIRVRHAFFSYEGLRCPRDRSLPFAGGQPSPTTGQAEAQSQTEWDLDTRLVPGRKMFSHTLYMYVRVASKQYISTQQSTEVSNYVASRACG